MRESGRECFVLITPLCLSCLAQKHHSSHEEDNGHTSTWECYLLSVMVFVSAVFFHTRTDTEIGILTDKCTFKPTRASIHPHINTHTFGNLCGFPVELLISHSFNFILYFTLPQWAHESITFRLLFLCSGQKCSHYVPDKELWSVSAEAQCAAALCCSLPAFTIKALQQEQYAVVYSLVCSVFLCH